LGSRPRCSRHAWMRVAAGLMERRTYSGHEDHYEYLLTDKGRDLAPVVIALTVWGDRWAAPDGAPILYRRIADCRSGGRRLQRRSRSRRGPGRDRLELTLTANATIGPLPPSTGIFRASLQYAEAADQHVLVGGFCVSGDNFGDLLSP
jgi:hypothetical protein